MPSSSTTNTSDGGKPSYPRGHWRPGEDEKLRQLVEKYGPQNWNSIAEKLEGRSGKSCRLRWFNQLDPRINKRPFTEEEEDRLLAAHRVHGNKWALIARHFPGRTDNAVKNHWHVVRARRNRERCRLLTKATTSTFAAYTDAGSSCYGGGGSGSGSQLDFGGAAATGRTLYFSFSKHSSGAGGRLFSSSPAAPSPTPLIGSCGGPGSSKMNLLSRYRSYVDRGKQLVMAPASLSVAFSSSSSSSSSPTEAMSLNVFSHDYHQRKDNGHDGGGGGDPSKRTVPFIDFLGVGMSTL